MGSLVLICNYFAVDFICFAQNFRIMLFDTVPAVGGTAMTQLQST